jgi:Flp pilus assembly protein TadB
MPRRQLIDAVLLVSAADLTSLASACEGIEVVVTKDVVTDEVSALEAAERWERVADVVRFGACVLKCYELGTSALKSAAELVKEMAKFNSCESGLKILAAVATAAVAVVVLWLLLLLLLLLSAVFWICAPLVPVMRRRDFVR